MTLFPAQRHGRLLEDHRGDSHLKPPTVTVVDPTAPGAVVVDVLPSHRAPRPWGPRTKHSVGGAVVLLLAASAVAHELSTRTRARVAAESALLRLQVVGVSVDRSAGGRPSSPAQDAVVDLTVRNSSPFRLRVVRQQLDGGGPADPGPRGPVAPRSTTVLTVRWRVLCAEVGELPGPRVLLLRVSAPHAEHVVRIPLAQVGLPGSPRQAFSAASVSACAVLLPGSAS